MSPTTLAAIRASRQRRAQDPFWREVRRRSAARRAKYGSPPGASALGATDQEHAVSGAAQQAVHDLTVEERSDPDNLTIIVAPFAPATFVGYILFAFRVMSEKQAAICALAIFAITLILMRRLDGRELLHRLAEWMAPPDDE